MDAEGGGGGRGWAGVSACGSGVDGYSAAGCGGGGGARIAAGVSVASRAERAHADGIPFLGSVDVGVPAGRIRARWRRRWGGPPAHARMRTATRTGTGTVVAVSTVAVEDSGGGGPRRSSLAVWWQGRRRGRRRGQVRTRAARPGELCQGGGGLRRVGHPAAQTRARHDPCGQRWYVWLLRGVSGGARCGCHRAAGGWTRRAPTARRGRAAKTQTRRPSCRLWSIGVARSGCAPGAAPPAKHSPGSPTARRWTPAPPLPAPNPVPCGPPPPAHAGCLQYSCSVNVTVSHASHLHCFHPVHDASSTHSYGVVLHTPAALRPPLATSNQHG